jgi:hypothetical protein
MVQTCASQGYSSVALLHFDGGDTQSIMLRNFFKHAAFQTYGCVENSRSYFLVLIIFTWLRLEKKVLILHQ